MKITGMYASMDGPHQRIKIPIGGVMIDCGHWWLPDANSLHENRAMLFWAWRPPRPYCFARPYFKENSELLVYSRSLG